MTAWSSSWKNATHKKRLSRHSDGISALFLKWRTNGALGKPVPGKRKTAMFAEWLNKAVCSGAGNGTRTHDLRITNGDFDVLQFFAVFNERRCYAVYRHFTFYPIPFRMAHFHYDSALMAHSNSGCAALRKRRKRGVCPACSHCGKLSSGVPCPPLGSV